MLLTGALAGSAQAQTAYVAGADAESVTPFDSETLIAAPAIPTESVAAQVAISPDGRTAYVTGYSTGEVLMIDTSTDAVRGSISGFGNPIAIAISPDGGTLYVADAGGESVVTASTATEAVTGAPIIVGDWATGLAVAPDGATVYASLGSSEEVVPIDAATREVGEPIGVGSQPEFLAFTPDGSKLYVPNYMSESVSVIDTESETVVDTVEVGLYPQTLVPSPDGSRVYVVNNGDSQISVIDTATDEVVGQPTDVVERPFGAAITADGSRLLVAGSEAQEAQAIDTATMTTVDAPPIELGGYAEGLAIVPAQTPVPEFSAAVAAAGSATGFDAAASYAYDGRITRYDWDFGDGTSAVDAGPTPTHVYATDGTYRVTLTVSNGQGCPGFVFTGGTAICGGPSVASTTQQVRIGNPSSGAVTPLTGPRSVRVHCPARAKRGGCRFKLQLVTGRPKKLRNGKRKMPKPASAVVRLKLAAGQSARVALRPRPKFAARFASRSRVVVKRTRVMRGKARTDFPRLALIS